MLNYKEIHLGNHIKEISKIKNLSVSRACTFLKCNAQEIHEMYEQKSLDSELLLKWCKLLDYNFFMFYHSHLQLYKPSAATTHVAVAEKASLPNPYVFKKNLYSPELIDYILKKLDDNVLSIGEVIKLYNIPRTTIYRWVKKRNHRKSEQIAMTEHSAKKKVNYKGLYVDYLTETESLDPLVKHILSQKIKEFDNQEITYNRISQINRIIKKYGKDSFDEIEYQKLKAYDKDQILSILKEQEEFDLTNCEISSKYNMSRTTIARWKALYGA